MKYIIDYLDKSGDLSHVWVNASNECEAEYEARSEFWDIDEILQVRSEK